MSLLFKETFNQYPIGHNLIGSGNMDWTVRLSIGNVLAFGVDSNYKGYFNKISGSDWGAISCNHSNIGSMFTDGKIVFHPKALPGKRWIVLFKYNSSGGYLIQRLDWELRLMRFNGWNFLNGLTIIQNWDALNPVNVYEVEIDLSGVNKTLYINNKLIGTDVDATHSAGLIGMGIYQTGWTIDDIYVFDNNSMSPVAPTNLILTVLNANSIKLNFDNLAFNADFISIERKNGISGTFLEIDRAPGNAQSYIDRYCQPGNDYYYQVRVARL